MSRRRIGEGLTPSRAERRVYPKVGVVDTPHDITEIRQAIESDPTLTRNEKRQRLLFMYAITHATKFKGQFKGNLRKSRAELKQAYQRYTKGRTVSTL